MKLKIQILFLLLILPLIILGVGVQDAFALSNYDSSCNGLCTLLLDNDIIKIGYTGNPEIGNTINIIYDVKDIQHESFIISVITSPTGEYLKSSTNLLDIARHIDSEDFYSTIAGDYTISLIFGDFTIISETITIKHPPYCGMDISQYTSIINGTNENDYLIGTNATDLIFGYEGKDFINGMEGADCIISGRGSDVIINEHTLNDNIFFIDNDNLIDYDKSSDYVINMNNQTITMVNKYS